MFFIFFFFFLLMENLGAMAFSRYTGFCEITNCDVLQLHCTCANRAEPDEMAHNKPCH